MLAKNSGSFANLPILLTTAEMMTSLYQGVLVIFLSCPSLERDYHKNHSIIFVNVNFIQVTNYNLM